MGYKVFWGDIHNHNSMGYAKGSLERSIDIARNSLDFFAFTGQCQWHDMKSYENNAHMHWINGFKVHNKNWPKIQKLILDANKNENFTAFIGYEFHSSEYGDYCIIFPDDNSELKICKGIDDLKKIANKKHAIIIPHHLGYKKGHRGFNIDVFDQNVSPVVEIYSEHGSSERDGGPYEMITHSMGGRTTQNTLQSILKKHNRVGVVASTDDHLGYPGAYGEGLAAVYAEKCDRESIWDALLNRRTYAVTGDRINLYFTLNEKLMGSVLDYTREREIMVDVDGWDEIMMIELIKNNKVVYRHFPEEVNKEINCIKTRLEYGWGPWSDLSISRICDWEFNLNVSNAYISDHCICFQSGPFSEEKRNRINYIDSQKCNWISYTSRNNAYMKRATNSIVFKIEGINGNLELNIKKPAEMKIKASIKKLLENSKVEFTGSFPKESVKIHKAVPEYLYKTDFKYTDTGDGEKEDFYYVRVTQCNGQMAWSSPIWVKEK